MSTEHKQWQVDEEQVRQWLMAQAAKYAKVDDSEIDCDTPLSQYGLDSVSAVAIAVDIEDEFGVVLDVDTLWKYPTVNLVVELLGPARQSLQSQGRSSGD